MVKSATKITSRGENHHMYFSQWPRGDTTRRRRGGERAVCRLTTNSIRLLTNYTSTITLCGVPGPQAIGKEPWLCILKVLWVGSFLPSYVSLHSFESLAYFHLHTRTVLHSHIVKTSRSTATMTSGSIGTYSIDIDPVGEHTEKRLVTLLASTFSYGANLSCFL